jgi:sorbitol-specific phosphotransferase system component IIBC
MTVIMLFIIYLLIGAILGWINHKMFEDVIAQGLVNMPMNVRGLFVIGSVIIILLLAPLVGLYDLVTKLKPKKNKS